MILASEQLGSIINFFSPLLTVTGVIQEHLQCNILSLFSKTYTEFTCIAYILHVYVNGLAPLEDWRSFGTAGWPRLHDCREPAPSVSLL